MRGESSGAVPTRPADRGADVGARRVRRGVVPPDVAVDRAALVDAFAVGEYYVRNSRIDTAAVPLVIGAGAIGLSAVAALARRGLSPVVVADYNAARLATAWEFGATHTVDPRERSPYDLWQEVALGDREAPGVMADEQRDAGAPRCFVYEFVGLPGVLDEIVRGCPVATQIFSAGGPPEGDHISSAVAKRKGLVIHFGGGPKPQDWYGTLDAVVAGTLDPSPAIGLVVDLDGLPDALDLARRLTEQARIMVHPHGDMT